MDLKQSIAIPGTKIKIPMIEAIAAGAAVIGAYVLIKGQSSQSTDVSTLPADTTTPATDATSVLNGQLETMGQELAAIEAALSAGAAQTSGGGAASVGGSGTVSVPAEEIPLSDPTAPGAAGIEIIAESINPKAIITPTGPGTATVEMPVSAPAKSVSPEKTTAPSTVSNSKSTAGLTSNIAPNPLPAPKSANAASSTTSINPKSAGSVKISSPVPSTQRLSKANAAALAGSK